MNGRNDREFIKAPLAPVHVERRSQAIVLGCARGRNDPQRHQPGRSNDAGRPGKSLKDRPDLRRSLLRSDIRGCNGSPGLRAEGGISGAEKGRWRTNLRQHLAVFGLATLFGLGAYAIVSLFIYLNKLSGFG